MARFPDKTALGAGPSLRVERQLPGDDGAALIARGAQALAKGVDDATATLEQRANAAELFDAQARLIDFKDTWSRKLAERQRAVEPGAAGFRAGIEREFLEDADAYYAGLPHRLRPAFKLKLREFDSQVMGAADAFEAQQGERRKVARIDDARQKLQARLTQNPGELPSVRVENEELIDSSGLPPNQKEEIKRKSAVQLSDTARSEAAEMARRQDAEALSRFDQRLTGDLPEAASWLDANKQALSPTLGNEMQARLNDEVIRRSAREVAERARSEVIAGAKNAKSGSQAETTAADFTQQARKEAQSRPDASPELIAMAEQAALEQYERDHAQQVGRWRDALQRAYTWADANPGKRLLDIPPTIWRALDDRLRPNVAAYLDAKGQVKTDPATWYQLQKMATSSPDEFASLNLLEYKHLLSPSDYRTTETLQAGAKAGDPTGDLAHLRSAQQVRDDTLRMLELDPGATSERNRSHLPKIEKFARRFHEEVLAFEKEKGKRATSQELYKVSDRLVMRIHNDPSGPFNQLNVRRYDLKVEDIPEALRVGWSREARARDVALPDSALLAMFAVKSSGEVPPWAISGIATSLLRKGHRVSDASIVNVWRLHKSIAAKTGDRSLP